MDLERLAPRHDPLGLRGRPFTSAFIERELDRLHQAHDLLSRRHVGGARTGAERVVVEVVERRERSELLEHRVAEENVTGLTSNPTIFQKAIAEGSLYDEQIRAFLGLDQSGWEVLYAAAIGITAAETEPPGYPGLGIG